MKALFHAQTGPRAATPSKKLSRTLDLDKDTEDPYDFNEADETTSTSRSVQTYLV